MSVNEILKRVDKCVDYLKRFLEEGHIPGLTPSDELLARFREKCMDEFILEVLEAFPGVSRYTIYDFLSIKVRDVEERPRWRPCSYAFRTLCQELEKEGLLEIPAAEAYELFDNWLQEQLSSKQ